MQKDWQALLYRSIPLASAMAVNTQVMDDGRIDLLAPLAPNVNDKGTAFGGSLVTLATLAGWIEIQRLLDDAGLGADVEVVIQRGETAYLLPVRADFSAVVQPQCPDVLQRFLRQFERRGLARLMVEVTIVSAGESVARFQADYVAKRGDFQSTSLDMHQIAQR
ncbi:YiiD C-terminal domain-containing protein [Chitinimonas sp. BJB300]|uniref:YiiD C-terminal domain-containing protein n=1 Tax=Chitinimonas sp. BJB300 TaxID=1559339 RepID=UPI000C1127E2|nr:YiiD C-terminal domain-containing protein [Chitinimonas sp. BJB300]PHV11452.1 thioesterase [Chitinimonas sp. BJB300]TSJ87221.1 thioesterase [Chitinimonas sp. BJB300]